MYANNNKTSANCTVFIGGLPDNVTSQQLNDTFKRFGLIRRVNIVPRQPRAIAFIEFEESRAANDAINRLDGKNVYGVRIRVAPDRGRRVEENSNRSQQNITSCIPTVMPLEVGMVAAINNVLPDNRFVKIITKNDYFKDMSTNDKKCFMGKISVADVFRICYSHEDTNGTKAEAEAVFDCNIECLENDRLKIALKNGGRHCFKMRYFYVDILDSSKMDAKYDHDFSNYDYRYEKEYYRGGMLYKRPIGAMRYGIKAIGVYSDDKWLGSGDNQYAGNRGEWPVAYHGTPLHNVGGIVRAGLRLDCGKRFVFGKGIYCTPDPRTALIYAERFPSGDKNYMLIFQTRVRPGSFRIISEAENKVGEYWIVANDTDIRSYGLCVYTVDKAMQILNAPSINHTHRSSRSGVNINNTSNSSVHHRQPIPSSPYQQQQRTSTISSQSPPYVPHTPPAQPPSQPTKIGTLFKIVKYWLFNRSN